MNAGVTLVRRGWLSGLLMLSTAGCYDGLSLQADTAGESATEGGTADAAGSDTDDPSGGSGDTDGSPTLPDDPDQIGKSGLRRLSAHDYDNTLRDILLDDIANSELLLPEDPRNPFDNDYTQQVPSQALIEGADLLAADAVERLLADPARRDQVVGCMPTAPGDETCMRDFITRFGRLALRRPLSEQEIELYLHGESGSDGAIEHAVSDGDFYTGVDTFLRAVLQDPEFLYRVEIGQPVQGDDTVYKLGAYEVATRLSYFLWGSTPDDWLLDSAEAGMLDDPDSIRDVAAAMLADERAIDRVDRFHALWLGYETMSFGGELADAMRAETKATLQRVIFDEGRSWHDIFRLDETFVNDTLAEHYGMPLPGSTEPTWVPFDDPNRRGILGQGAFLSVGGKFGDTSPVQRGLLIRTRLFCTDIPPPPPDIDADQEPSEGICKTERYAAHSSGGCAGCHDMIDPVGFGLENYDAQGRFRAFEPDDPETPDDESQCEIPGDGELVGIGTFNGPAELGQLALEAGLLDHCVVTQLYRYAMGRYELDELDEAFIEHVVGQLEAGAFRFDDLALQFVSSQAFGYRREG